ncbi:hypothetical protein BGW42_005446 [Actinomortierella wolfii]|nr:hypothetical protein BGW42_005446 [Actinomortierella wolfii]
MNEQDTRKSSAVEPREHDRSAVDNHGRGENMLESSFPLPVERLSTRDTTTSDASGPSTIAPSSVLTWTDGDRASILQTDSSSILTAPVADVLWTEKDKEQTETAAGVAAQTTKSEQQVPPATAADTWLEEPNEKRCEYDVESQISYISRKSSKDNSPIEEVRAIVPAITYTVVSLVSLPIGNLMARTFSTKKFRVFGYEFSFNPGPFNIKEHALIGTAVACSSGTAYAVDIVILQRKYYNDDQGFLAGFLLILTTQITGFSLAGVLRKFLVKPAHMIWPANLVTVALFRTLHEQKSEDCSGYYKGPSRMRYFALVTTGSFVWYWFPNYIFPALTALSVLCWIKPDNVVLAQLTGSSGLGIGTISLDWASSTSALAPLVTPWWAQVNILVGFIIIAWIVAPIAYYSNLWNSKMFPILTADLFRDDGTPYDKSMVMTDNVLDPAKYEAYGPLRMDSFFALTYGIGFAGLTATLTHVALYHGEQIRRQWRAALASISSSSSSSMASAPSIDADIHSQMMKEYKEVPQWWYGALFLISLALSILTVVRWHYLPWYYLILSLVIAFVFALPVGVVQAVTNQQPGLNVITEYVIGYLMPGHPIANVTFKAYGYITNVQALQFTQDLKLGHYMKIPPRIMFWVQIISSIIAGLVNLATTDWLLRVRPNICTKADYPWTCRNTNS